MRRKRLLIAVLFFLCLLCGCEKEETHEKATLVWENTGTDRAQGAWISDSLRGVFDF